MRIGAKNGKSVSPIIAERTKCTLEYALSVLQKSEISPYIQQVYLYGSCARNQQSYDSDVDLLVELDSCIDIEKYKSVLLELKGRVSPAFSDLPEVDMHVVVGDDWKSDKMLYYQNIRREGIEIWGKQKTHI